MFQTIRETGMVLSGNFAPKWEGWQAKVRLGEGRLRGLVTSVTEAEGCIVVTLTALHVPAKGTSANSSELGNICHLTLQFQLDRTSIHVPDDGCIALVSDEPQIQILRVYRPVVEEANEPLSPRQSDR